MHGLTGQRHILESLAGLTLVALPLQQLDHRAPLPGQHHKVAGHHTHAALFTQLATLLLLLLLFCFGFVSMPLYS